VKRLLVASSPCYSHPDDSRAPKGRINSPGRLHHIDGVCAAAIDRSAPHLGIVLRHGLKPVLPNSYRCILITRRTLRRGR